MFTAFIQVALLQTSPDDHFLEHVASRSHRHNVVQARADTSLILAITIQKNAFRLSCSRFRNFIFIYLVAYLSYHETAINALYELI